MDVETGFRFFFDGFEIGKNLMCGRLSEGLSKYKEISSYFKFVKYVERLSTYWIYAISGHEKNLYILICLSLWWRRLNWLRNYYYNVLPNKYYVLYVVNSILIFNTLWVPRIHLECEDNRTACQQNIRYIIVLLQNVEARDVNVTKSSIPEHMSFIA